MKTTIFAWLFALFPISHIGLQSDRIHSRCQGLYFQMAMIYIHKKVEQMILVFVVMRIFVYKVKVMSYHILIYDLVGY